MSCLISEYKDRVLRLQLNRPRQRNALSAELFAELKAALTAADVDSAVGAVIITGSGGAFAAGVDIAELAAFTAAAASADDMPADWTAVAACRKPVLAAVNGMALGGGCELAMMCDFIIAAESATFALPEIKLGTMPGIGGTQRLVHAVGKAKAMEMCLTGRAISAPEAERAGLVARVVADAALAEAAWQSAALIAGYSQPALFRIKESVNMASELPLAAGLRHEQQLFHSTFAFADCSEGIAAFLEKRSPLFKHK